MSGANMVRKQTEIATMDCEYCGKAFSVHGGAVSNHFSKCPTRKAYDAFCRALLCLGDAIRKAR